MEHQCLNKRKKFEFFFLQLRFWKNLTGDFFPIPLQLDDGVDAPVVAEAAEVPVPVLVTAADTVATFPSTVEFCVALENV